MSNNNDKAERGSIISTILEVLKSGDKYGYEIIKEVEQKSGIVLKQPSLYSCLTRLENQGIISSYWTDSDIGGRRHYYKLVNMMDSEATEIEENNNFIDDKIDMDQVMTISNSINISTKNDNKLPNNINEIKSQIKNIDNTSKCNCKGIKSICELQNKVNNSVINELKNKILLNNEKYELIPEEEEKQNDLEQIAIPTPSINSSDVKINNKYENILGDILYDKKSKVKQELSAQQQFNFENNEIKVDNNKGYMNNVLLKTANKEEVKSDVSKRKAINQHFNSLEELSDALKIVNVNLKEYSYINYQSTNNNKYLSINKLFLFSILKTLMYLLFTCFYFIFLQDFSQLQTYLVCLTSLSLIEVIICYFRKVKANNSLIKINYVMLIFAVIEIIVSLVISLGNPFNFSNLLVNAVIFLPIINIISLFFSKKVSNKK